MSRKEICYSVMGVVLSHVQPAGCQPERTTTLHGGQSHSWPAELSTIINVCIVQNCGCGNTN